MQKVKENMFRNGRIVIDKIQEIKKLIKDREEARAAYDHYRSKLTDMEKPGKQSSSSDPKDQEQYTRNVSKFDNAKVQFEELTKNVGERLTKAEDKIERVILDLTLKFSKQIQMQFFKDMNNSFFKLKDVEAEMIDIAHQEYLREQERQRQGEQKAGQLAKTENDQFRGELDKWSRPAHEILGENRAQYVSRGGYNQDGERESV